MFKKDGPVSIEIRNIFKKFGNAEVLKGISLEILPGQLVAFLGPSGSGKTTLLRIIAGLEVPDYGEILLHGENTRLQKVSDRQVGFVFQHYALFRHMSVFENVAFGLRVKPKKERLPEQLIQNKVHELLHLVQLEQFSRMYPHQLSGGQRQRIALARALAIEPKMLLLDEPFGSLDAKVRKELRRWLRSLHDKLRMTSIFVTHDVEEALEIADRVVITHEGQIEQIGSPEEIYHFPKNDFVRHFIGDIHMFHCRREDGTLLKIRKKHIHVEKNDDITPEKILNRDPL